MDGVLQLLSADGFVLEQNDDYHGLDPQIAFRASKDGTYLVRVFAFPSVPDASIRFAGKENFVYRLTLTTGPFVEYTYPLSVSREGPAMVDLVGWNIPDDMRRFPVTPKGEGPLKLFDPRIANLFSVHVESQRAIVKATDRETPQKIVMPVTITGRLDRPGDIDIYEINAKKGEKLLFRIESRTLGFPLDPILRLQGPDGKTLAQAKAAAIGTDASLNYTTVQDGTHRLEVSDLHGEGGVRYVYRLRAGPIAPDFELKVASDMFSLSPGKPLEIPVSITRVGGFNQDIKLSIEGLPKEVSVMTTAKAITLKLSDKTAFAGPIHIVGTAKDATTRRARAAVAELGRTTDSLWLTVLRK
jgi:hypothetical protein